MDVQPIFYAIAVLMVLVGLAGTILPALPGLPLVFAGMLLAAWTNGYEQVPVWVVVLLGLLTALSLLVDLWATAIGARRVGASRGAVVGAVFGTIVGLFFGIIGLFAGPFAGAMAGELLAGRGKGRPDLRHATRVGFGTWLGIVFGTALKLMLAFAMIGIFISAWLLS
jgi:uncharacterized protein YqgC (DUF456 family)